MEKVNVLSLIKQRSQYPFGRDGDAWIDEIIRTNKETAYIITLENLATLRGLQGKSKKQTLFKTYHVSGVFALSNSMVETSVPLMLLVLKKSKGRQVLSGTYEKKIIRRRSHDSLDKYPSDFYEYCQKIEIWINEGVFPNDGDCYKFNAFSSDDIDVNKLQPHRYSKSVYDIYQFLEQEKTVRLSTIASVIKPRPIQGENAKIISGRDFTYPLDCEKVKSDCKTDTMLHKGDILFKCGVLNKSYLFLDEPCEDIYAGKNDIVIRLNNANEAAYLYSFIQSDTGQTVISANAIGVLLTRLTLSDWQQLPIILPKRPLVDYEEYFRLKNYRQDSILKYYDFSKSISREENPHNVEDILNIEMLNTAKFYKEETIRAFLQEDLKELNSCFRAKAYKASLIMCGSILEAVLVDWVSEKHNKNYFEEELSVTGKDGRPRRADLIDYINIIEEIKRPSWMDGARKAHTIRKKRNLVHAKLCLKSDEISESVCREIIDYLRDVLITRGFVGL